MILTSMGSDQLDTPRRPVCYLDVMSFFHGYPFMLMFPLRGMNPKRFTSFCISLICHKCPSRDFYVYINLKI